MLYGSRVRRLGFAEGVKGGRDMEGGVVAQQICTILGEVKREREITKKRGG